MAEVWKDIEGYEGLYQVSNLGRVKSLQRLLNTTRYSNRTCKERVLKPLKSKQSKYYSVSLYKSSKQKVVHIHRLVAISFVPNPKKSKEVNHIDGDISNNKVENLEWCTRSENQLHAYATGLQKPKYKEYLKMAVEKRKRKIMQLDMAGNHLKTFESIAAAGREMNVKGANISKVANGLRNSAGGFKWIYQSDVEEIKE